MNALAGVVAGVLVLGAALTAGGAVRAAAGRRAARRLLPERSSRVGLLAAPAWLPARLDDAGVDWTPNVVWSAWALSSGVTTAVALVVGGPGLAAVAVTAAVVGPLSVARAARGRGAARIEAALPLALESVARSLRSGAALRQAISEAATEAAGSLGAELARVAADAARGTPIVEALEAWATRSPLPGVRLAVAALALGAETGGAQARAIDGVAVTLRQRLGVTAEAKALATQARASAAVIAIAPLVFCVLASAADPRLATFLLRTPLGLVILGAGLALDTVGALWMARLTRLDA